ncbi:MAG TPA: hypothetical protein VJV78_42750 [Polyangiales bacterium]|nr:hypothetical protein [Polyangiales bacterium]
MKPSPLVVVRAITTVITSVIWWCLLWVVGWVFSGAGKVDHVSPLVIANLTAVSYLFVPYFVTEGSLVSMIGTLMKGRIIMPPVTEDPKAKPANPWIWGAIHSAVFGIVPAIVGYKMAMGVSPDSLTPGEFGERFAWGGTLVCAIVAWFVSGRLFLKQVQVPRPNRLFAGDVNRYLWTRYGLPHGIANLIINGLLAFALSPVGSSEPGAHVESKLVVADAVITFFVLTWIVSAGVKGMARCDAEWGIAPEHFGARELHMPAAFLPCFFSGIGFCIVLGIGAAWFDVEGISQISWVVFRGVVFGAFCGWCAMRCAQASINEHFHPEMIVHTRKPQPAAAPATASAASATDPRPAHS